MPQPPTWVKDLLVYGAVPVAAYLADSASSGPIRSDPIKTGVVLGAYLLAALLYWMRRRSNRSQQAQEWRVLIDRWGGLIRYEDQVPPGLYSRRRRYAAFKVTFESMLDDVNWVDHFYLRALRRLARRAGFRPLILVDDSRRARRPDAAERRKFKKTVSAYIGGGFDIKYLSSLRRRNPTIWMWIDPQKLLHHSTEIVRNLMGVEPQSAEESARRPRRAAKAIMWSLVLSKYSKRSSVLLLQWDNDRLYSHLDQNDGIFLLWVKDFVLLDEAGEAKSGKLDEPGKLLAVRLKPNGMISHSAQLKAWVKQQRERDLTNLITLCRALRGCWDLDSEFSNHRLRTDEPSDQQLLGRIRATFDLPEGVSDRWDHWQKCAYLVGLELEGQHEALENK